MNRIRFIAIGSMLVFGLTGFAWQREHPANTSAPEVEEHLQVLAARLDLTNNQQDRIRPALAEMMEATRDIEQDQNITSEARAERIRAAHQKADRKVREVLNDEQKKKLDQLEQEHFGAH